MKHIRFFAMLLICLGATNNAFCQPTAIGGCNSAEVTGGIPGPTNATPFWTGGFIPLGSNGNPCKRVWTTSGTICGDGANDPWFTLQRLNTNGSWTNAAPPQSCPEFDNITIHGTYRIGIQLPVAIGGSGGCQGGFVSVYNLEGQLIGNRGSYTNAPYVYTNTFVIGAATSADNSYTFMDNPGGAEPAYDFGEVAKMNTSASKDYNLWYLAILEEGPTYNRYQSQGWTYGKVPNNVYNLTNLWKSTDSNWNFEPFHAYTVQFVTENADCRNGIEYNPSGDWNMNARTFFICPAGSGCRIGEDAQKIVLSPNPASSVVRLHHFEMEAGAEYHLTITDLAGKMVRSITLLSNEVDISGLSNGMYALTIERDGKRIFTDKLVVNQ